jgi:hypothetical protein
MRKLLNFVWAMILAAGFFSCTKEEVPKIPATYASFKVGGNDTVIADNFSAIEISVQLDTSSSKDQKAVSFTTTIGSFIEGGTTVTVNSDIGGVAKVHFKSNTIGNATLKASITGNSTNLVISKDVYCSAAWPDLITINTSATLSHGLGNKLQVSANCLRNFGTVSQNIQVQFYATDTLNHGKGAFYNISPTDQAGKANSEFWLQDTTFSGYLYIYSKVVTNKNQTILGKTQVFVTK